MSERSGHSGERMRFGPFEANLHTRELWKFGIRIRLAGQPFEVLEILLNKPGELVSRDELRERLWQGATYVGFDHGLNAAVNRLREALNDSVDEPRYVETLPRLGYRFISPVEKISAAVSPQPASLEVSKIPPAGTPSGFPTVVRTASTPVLELPGEASAPNGGGSVGPGPKPRNVRWYIGAAVALLILSIAGTLVLRMASFGARADRASAESHESGTTDGHSSFAPVQRIRPLTSLAEETSEPAFSPDGNYVAFRRVAATPEGSGIFVKAIGSEQLVQLTRNSEDCCPVWSPDGRTIAFSRFANTDIGIYLVSAAAAENQASLNGLQSAAPAGTEQKLDTGGINPRRPELAWAPDGKTIAFNGGSSIFLLSLEKSGVRKLTEPPPLSEDWGPAFSPDGQEVLFVRSQQGSPEEILSIPADGGEVTHMAADRARVLGPPQWSADGQSIIFASDHGSHPGLWRVSAGLRDTPVQINDSGWYPAVSRHGYRLAYQRITRNLSIWELDLSAPGRQRKMLIPSTSETDQGPGPQISPDGTKLAYMSDRSGTMEIWVSDRDGKNPFQLTAVGGAGTPRWSPDGQSIAFDANGRNAPSVYVVTLKGGAPREIGGSDDPRKSAVCPSWSHDGKWVYFTSTRSGKFQVWKAPAQGGDAVQVTKLGGHAPLESEDGKYIYYAKTHYANPEIWQVPVEGGPEKLLSPLLRPASWASWAVVDSGIVFAGPSGKGRPVVEFFDLATHQERNLGELNMVPFWLGASRDGKSVVFDQPGWEQAQLMLVENFR